MCDRMKSLVIYIHGKGGDAKEAQYYQSILTNSVVVGFDYKSQTPWEAKGEFADFYDLYSKDYKKDNLTSRETMTGFANRIGAALTIMEDGEHRFHSVEEKKFLDKWVKTSISQTDLLSL